MRPILEGPESRGQSQIDKTRRIPDLVVTVKHLLASLVLLTAINLPAQSTFWNPDADVSTPGERCTRDLGIGTKLKASSGWEDDGNGTDN